jgi:hypothetical protein
MSNIERIQDFLTESFIEFAANIDMYGRNDERTIKSKQKLKELILQLRGTQ